MSEYDSSAIEIDTPSDYESAEYESIARRYIEVWNDADPAARRSAIGELFIADATYTDPLAVVAGIERIDALVADVQQQFAGLRFRLGPVDGHHDIARFTWSLGAGDDEPVVVGFDVITLRDGRIARVQGFLDTVPG